MDEKSVADGSGNAALPPPPDEESLFLYTQGQWNYIKHWWKRGYAADTRLEALEAWLEDRRQAIFVDGNVDAAFDWRADWGRAKSWHDYQVDEVKHHRTHLEGVKQIWTGWADSSTTHFSNISLEALRSIVLLNGAAIIAALAVLTGQISTPRASAILTAKITTVTSVVSMVMIATGHAILWDRMSNMVGQVRNSIVGSPRNSRVYSVSRYLRRHLDPVTRWANGLIYGSIVVFAASALVCALVLAFG